MKPIHIFPLAYDLDVCGLTCQCYSSVRPGLGTKVPIAFHVVLRWDVHERIHIRALLKEDQPEVSGSIWT